jgi:hypothetical protein
MQEVNLKVPAAFAFDYLSILQVKAYKINTDETWDNFDRTYLNLLNELGELATTVYRSEEYTRLRTINAKIFDLVDEIKKIPTDARVVDENNYLRAKIKKEIQDKYFGGGSVETKVGYGENE